MVYLRKSCFKFNDPYILAQPDKGRDPAERPIENHNMHLLEDVPLIESIYVVGFPGSSQRSDELSETSSVRSSTTSNSNSNSSSNSLRGSAGSSPCGSPQLPLSPSLHEALGRQDSRYFVLKSANYRNLDISCQKGVWVTHVGNEKILNKMFNVSTRTVFKPGLILPCSDHEGCMLINVLTSMKDFAIYQNV